MAGTDARGAACGAAGPFVPIFQHDSGYETDSVVGIADGPDVELVIDNPWSGPSGHGTKSTIRLSPEAARALGAWLVLAGSTR
jgi:hypothetical protein